MRKLTGKIPTPTLILTLLGVFFLIWGGYQSSLASKAALAENAAVLTRGEKLSENDGRYVLSNELPKLTQAPRDPLTGVTAEGFILKRTVEMYQYEIIDDTVYKIFSEYQQQNIKGKNGELYTNPVFPDGLRSAVFFGEVKTGELTLADCYLSEFEYIYEPFEDSYSFYKITDLPEFDNDFGLVLTSEGCYDSGSPENRKIGDIRVSYQYFPTDAFSEITFFGKQVGGILGTENEDDTALMFDRRLTLEEVRAKAFADHASDARGLYIFGGIMLAVGAFLLVISLKNAKRREGESV